MVMKIITLRRKPLLIIIILFRAQQSIQNDCFMVIAKPLSIYLETGSKSDR